MSEKDRHELVHAGVGEKQIGRVRQKRRRRHNGVLFLAEEIEKGLANLRRGHGAEIKRTFRRMQELLPMEQQRQARAIERPMNVRRRRPRQTLAQSYADRLWPRCGFVAATF